MRIKIADLRAMARMLYAANCAFKAREPMQFERLSPNAKDAYLVAARRIMEAGE